MKDWENPLALFAGAELPTFPVHSLPTALREMAEALAEAHQVPVDLPAMLILSVCATVGAGKIYVEPKAGWRQSVNLYSATALPPGTGKSPVFRAVTEPLRRAEADLVASVSDDVVKSQHKADLADGRAKRLLTEAIRAEGAERTKLEKEAEDAQVEAASIERIYKPRLLADDVTP